MPRAAVVAVLVAALLGGCDRACGSVARRAWSGSALPATQDGGVDWLEGTDCSDGLVRCVDGHVEVSRLAHLPSSCNAAGEGRNACVCPWDVVAPCTTDCVIDGVVAHGDADAGARQLCRPETPVARPAFPGDPAPRICSDIGVACADGVVRRCDGPGRAEAIDAVCIYGCDPGIFLDHGQSATADGTAAILCRRAHAERR